MSVDVGGAADAIEPTAESSQPARTLTPGELLRAGRDSRGMSVQEVADELHLDVKLVQAIETNNFQLLGAPVYARGHLRKYASLLGLSPDAVIAQYQVLTDVPAAPTQVPVTATVQPRRFSLRIPAIIVAGILVAALMLWIAGWLVDRFDDGVQSLQQASTDVVRDSAPEPAPTPVERAAVAETTARPATNSPLPDVEAPSPGAVPANVPVARVSLQIEFDDACWVEIYAADGQRLLYDIGQPGHVRNIAGAAPLRVTLGLASAVRINANGRPLLIPRRPGRDAARFTVAADGSVQ
jgi:cytoskeleton protein RodZ